MIIGFSTGCFWNLDIGSSPLVAISYLKNCQSWAGGFNAIELSISPLQEADFCLNKENFEWLKSLKHISYHLVEITERTEFIIDRLPFVSCIVCHGNKKEMLPEGFLIEYKDKIIYENPISKSYLPRDAEICFDVAHALGMLMKTNDCRELDIQIIRSVYDTHKHQSKQIHLSNWTPEVEHCLFSDSEDNRRKFIQMALSIKDKPIIIESGFNSFDEMKQELKFIKENAV